MISPLAQVDPKAKIANNVTIDAFSVVYGDVEVGEGTHIMPNVTIFNGSRIGKHCKIFPGAVIGAIPQDLKYNGEQTTAEIGDYTTIREYVTIHLGTKDKWKTKVGNNCLLMAYAHVAHDCIVGNNVILANCVQLAGHAKHRGVGNCLSLCNGTCNTCCNSCWPWSRREKWNSFSQCYQSRKLQRH